MKKNLYSNIGMGFMGLLFLVTILTIIATAMIPNGLPNIDNERRRSVNETFNLMNTAMENFYRDMGRLPANLSDLYNAPGYSPAFGYVGYRGPYIRQKYVGGIASDNEILFDRWRQAYNYPSPGAGATQCTIRSSGPDRILNNADDIAITVNVTEFANNVTDQRRAATIQEMAVINAVIVKYKRRYPPASFPSLTVHPYKNIANAVYINNWNAVLVLLQGNTSPIPLLPPLPATPVPPAFSYRPNENFLPPGNEYLTDQFGSFYNFVNIGGVHQVTSPNVP